MLYTETVDAKTLDLIKKLMNDKELRDFNLVGGTALSLQIGHRKSIDVDLFSQKGFDALALKNHLEKEYGAIIRMNIGSSIKAEIGDVKLDIMAHQYPLVKPVLKSEGIRLVSLEDIGAMKINAISGNGTRVKDFIDMHSLLEYKNLKELIAAFVNKYPDVSESMAIESLKYFRDVDFDVVEKKLMKDFNWSKVTERLENAVKQPEKIFISQGQKLMQSLEQKLKQSQKLEKSQKLKQSIKKAREDEPTQRIRGQRPKR